MNDTIDQGNTFALLLSNHQHIHENIKFADQKAAFFVTLNGALMAFVYSLIKSGVLQVEIAGFAVCLFLMAGVAMGLFVIWPRGSTNRKRGAGVVDADRIYQFKSVADFISRCAVIADSELREEIRTFIFDRSRINYLKYKWLRRSITLSCIGWTGAIILCVVLKLHPLLNQRSALSLENLRMKMHERFFSSQDEFFVII